MGHATGDRSEAFLDIVIDRCERRFALARWVGRAIRYRAANLTAPHRTNVRTDYRAAVRIYFRILSNTFDYHYFLA
jgi:hypothetical protein